MALLDSYRQDILHAVVKTGRVSTIPDEELNHWGVMGMKWGKRKAQRLAKSRQTKEEATIQKLKTIDLSNLSDADMAAVTKRLNLEAEYRKSQAANRNTNLESISKILTTVGTLAVTTNNSVNAYKNIKSLLQGSTEQMNIDKTNDEKKKAQVNKALNQLANTAKK